MLHEYDETPRLTDSGSMQESNCMNPREYIEDTLKAQRCFILALQHMGLNALQEKELTEIYRMNQNLVYVLGVDVPAMQDLMKQAEQVMELERMFKDVNGTEEIC